MRPLKKPASGPNYAELSQNFQVSVADTDITFGLDAIYRFFAAHDWVALAAARSLSLADKTNIEQKNTRVKQLSQYYKNARFDLRTQLGEECVYCGIPTRARMAVEHVQPKNLFPGSMLLWSNFLPSCADCNSRKSAKPSGLPGDTLADYLWPQDMPAGHPFTYKLYLYEQTTLDGWDATPDLNGTLRELSVDDVFGMFFHNNIQLALPNVGHWAITATIPITSVGPVQMSLALLTLVAGSAADHTADKLVALNWYSGNQEAGDRRLIDRTQTWLQALDALFLLNQIRNESALLRQPFIDQIKETIEMSGFWSVWAEVFAGHGAGRIEELDRQAILNFLRTAYVGTDPTKLWF